MHGSLQTVDLATGAGLEDAVAAQTLAEGVLDHQELVLHLAQSALRSETVQRAAVRPHWRETYVGTTFGHGTVLAGHIDLVYEEDDGSLVIVDYKTDAVPAEALLARVAVYLPQMAARTPSRCHGRPGRPSTGQRSQRRHRPRGHVGSVAPR